MLKKLKSLFIIEEETADKKPAVKGKEADAKPEVQATPDDPVGAHTAEPGKVTSKFTEVLLRAMEKNNLEGFDYLEFKQSLKSLKKMAMDEKTRYQSAFAMAQTMGASPEKLVQAATHYLQVLQKEEQKFQQALANQKSKQIGDKEQQIKQIELLISEKTAQIKKLNEDIGKHRQLKENLTKEISQSMIKVESTKNNFLASYRALVGQISKDIENIKNFLR